MTASIATGRNLYPAFPFDHFTRVTDEDVSAIYAYIMTRDAVPSRVPANRLIVPDEHPSSAVGMENAVF